MLRKIINKVTFGLIYKKKFLLLDIGCFRNFNIIINLYKIFKLNKLTPQHREIIFRDLFGDEDVCPINKEKHDNYVDFMFSAAAMTLVRLNHEIKLSDKEITQIASFLEGNPGRQKEFCQLVKYFLERNELPHAEYNAFAQLFRQKEISRDFILQLLPIFIARYNKVVKTSIVNSIDLSRVELGTSSATREWKNLEEILNALILDNINLQREDYLALSYNSHPRIREIATSTHRCPEEGKIAASLIGMRE